MTTHLFIPDAQIKPGVKLNHLNALGNYIVHIQPDVIVCAGDWADMHSLSTYDVGRKAGEGARYEDDIRAASNGLEVLMGPLIEHNRIRSVRKEKQYRPRMVVTLGNHENRINRHVNNYPILQGKLSTDDIPFKKYGWEVHDFLEVIEIDGILYSHYFPRNAQGRVVQSHRGSPSAALQVQREGRSCSSGHLQGLDWHVQQRGDRRDYGLIAGSFYMHDEGYLCPQGTAYWRGVVWKHQVEDGNYDPTFVSLDYLMRVHWDGKEYIA